MTSPEEIPLSGYCELSADEMRERAAGLLGEARGRRSIRGFSDRGIPEGVLEDCLRIAGTAPSGANLQPWHFAVVQDAKKKRQIRLAAEEEERAFYQQRASEEWLKALAPLGTDPEKPFLETAPALVAIFSQPQRELADGGSTPNYYAKESVGIATGMLIHALHHCGLGCLTHTPSPMGFLNGICKRPPAEKAFLLLVVGYPADEVKVPKAAITRKDLPEITSFL